MSRKAKSGSHRKVDTAKHRKRQKREKANRTIKTNQRKRREREFAQRVREEPSLATLLDRERKSE